MLGYWLYLGGYKLRHYPCIWKTAPVHLDIISLMSRFQTLCSRTFQLPSDKKLHSESAPVSCFCWLYCRGGFLFFSCLEWGGEGFMAFSVFMKNATFQRRQNNSSQNSKGTRFGADSGRFDEIKLSLSKWYVSHCNDKTTMNVGENYNFIDLTN